MGPNESFFNVIYDSCYNKVASFVIAKCARVQDAQDILQEVFIEFYNLIEKKGVVYVNNPEALVMQMAKFKLSKFYKAGEKFKNEVPLYSQNLEGEEYENFSLDIDVPEEFVNKQTIDEIWRILRGKQQDVLKIFVLYYYLGNTIKEIAIYLEMSETAVKHKLYRTLASLRELYKKDV